MNSSTPSDEENWIRANSKEEFIQYSTGKLWRKWFDPNGYVYGATSHGHKVLYRGKDYAKALEALDVLP